MSLTTNSEASGRLQGGSHAASPEPPWRDLRIRRNPTFSTPRCLLVQLSRSLEELCERVVEVDVAEHVEGFDGLLFAVTVGKVVDGER
jgi:hypothetical protein